MNNVYVRATKYIFFYNDCTLLLLSVCLDLATAGVTKNMLPMTIRWDGVK